MKTRTLLPLTLLTLLVLLSALFTAPSIDYGQDIRPIPPGKCFSCHGLDVKQRKVELPLDSREQSSREWSPQPLGYA